MGRFWLSRHKGAIGLLLAVIAALVVLTANSSNTGAGASGSPSATATSRIATPPAQGPLQVENQKPGTGQWTSPELSRGRGQPIDEGAESQPASSKPAAPVGAAAATSMWTDTTIRGYADQTSVNHGSPIRFYIGTNQAHYSIEIYRMGWYGGSGATSVTSATGLPGQSQLVPTPDPTTGLVDLNWQVSYTLQTGSTWVSGVYLAKLVATDGSAAYITFVVRADGAPADIVYQLPLNTYQAYNNWGGKSLYAFNSTSGVPAVKVSYNRPYAVWSGAGGFFDGDYNMVRWLERSGYNVTYATSVDLEANASLLSGRKVFLSNYHDEYWSTPMRQHLTSARDAGVGLAFFDANNIFWQVRFEASLSTGAANRIIVCYKDATADPVATTNPPLTTVNWRSSPVNQPENALLGGMWESYWAFGTAFDWVVQNANSWIYAGTGLSEGAHIPQLVGYEYDKIWNNAQTPASTVSLSNSPVVDLNGVHSFQNGSVYTASGGNWVFNAGTTYWPLLLDDNAYQSHGADSRVQQMTANILSTEIAKTLPTGTPTPTPTTTPLAYKIYGDSLALGWSSCSWNATVSFSTTTPVYAGNDSISFSNTAGYGALCLSTSSPIDLTPYTALQFAAQGTSPGQMYNLQFYDQNGAVIGNTVLPNSYAGTPPVGSWRVYTIPFDSNNLNIAGKRIGSLSLQDYAGVVQPKLYLDELGFITTAGGTPTPTPSPTPTPCTSTSLTPSATSPQLVGTSITLAAAGAGCAQYQFYLAPFGGSYGVVQPYSSTASWTWNTSTYAAGAYYLLVFAKAAGSPNAYDSYALITYNLTNPGPQCPSVGLTPSLASPQTIGTNVALTAAGTGCTLYQFYLAPSGGTYAMVQPYSATAIWQWNTGTYAAGSYYLLVFAKAAGSTNGYDSYSAIPYTLTTPGSTCTSTTLAPSPASPQSVGTSITLTAAGAGCAQYQFYLAPSGGSYSIVQPYSATATWQWNTGSYTAGTYYLLVFAKAAGSVSSYDSYAVVPFTIT